MDSPITQDLWLRGDIICSKEILQVRVIANSLQLHIQNTFDKACADQELIKWVLRVEMLLDKIPSLEANANTRMEWYTSIYQQFKEALSHTPLRGELSLINARLQKIQDGADRESDQRMIDNLANAGNIPTSGQFPGYAFSVDFSNTGGRSIFLPTSNYNTSSSSLAGPARGLNHQDQAWLRESVRIRQGGYTPSQPYIYASFHDHLCRCHRDDESSQTTQYGSY
ncbi:uncharacterized protein BT62DRAFT_1080185 [Guyanagaster necrorhizus]|uniref:Uncharacterized protein n=1 Tax=Guyanagaster necrorhizus TaxID=856835 RepID=A0A9P7VJU0_9AGAR|nr:uncharacterized protein BT62DRAFT_1080185 [Guyanagaster necrorhizus MCA 3950]KAG7441311.1 hypothetical protein BT62DRAFT_1080185 [Guyanagaster necrorhizus MCA 3950]